MEVKQIDSLDDAVLELDHDLVLQLAKLRELEQALLIWIVFNWFLELLWQVPQVEFLGSQLLKHLHMPIFSRVNEEIVRGLSVLESDFIWFKFIVFHVHTFSFENWFT